MKPHRVLAIAAAVAVPLLAAAAAPGPRAQPVDTAATAGDRDRDLPSLKAAYLRCEQAASEGLLDSGQAGSCSVIYERLLGVGFGGVFQRLLAWWRSERVAEARGRAADTP